MGRHKNLISSYFYNYQRKFWADRSRLKIYNKSRQIGISFLLAWQAVMSVTYKGQDFLLASSSLRQSKELNYKCKKIIDFLKANVGLNIRLGTNNKEEIEVIRPGYSSNRIFSLPSKPETVRGFAGNVALDEFALHKDDREIYAALLPTITRGFELSIVSTPLGQSNLFYEIFTRRDLYPDFSIFQTTIYDAVKDGFDTDVEFLKRNVDSETWEQEYCCQFIDESTAFFPYELIRSCVGECSIMNDSPNFLGVDIGLKHDRTVITILSKVGDKLKIKLQKVLHREPFPKQKELIKRLANENNVVRGYIDATGMGIQLSEELKNDVLRPFSFSLQSKEKLVTQMKKIFEGKRIEIPDDRELISNIHSIKKIITSYNNIRFDAERDKRGHNDMFWSLALAVEAARRPTTTTTTTKLI